MQTKDIFFRTTPPLFRFTKREYALALVKEGKLRLNPPLEFHDEKKHGPMIGDRQEGQRNTTFENVLAGQEDTPAPFRDFVHFKDPTNPLNPKLIIVSAEVTEQCEWALIYCFLEQPLASCTKGFPGDTWLKVHDPFGFCLSITSALEADMEFRGLHRCHYIGRSIKYGSKRSKVHPLLLKDDTYASQREVRAIWTSRSKARQSKPLDVCWPKATNFCEIIEPNPTLDTPRPAGHH